MKRISLPLKTGYIGRHILDDKDILFARCYDKDEAAHILKCVNMHDELVSLLGDIHDFLKRSGYDTKLVRETIKKAGAL